MAKGVDVGGTLPEVRRGETEGLRSRVITRTAPRTAVPDTPVAARAATKSVSRHVPDIRGRGAVRSGHHPGARSVRHVTGRFSGCDPSQAVIKYKMN